MYELWKLFLRISLLDSKSVFGDTSATHVDLTAVLQSSVCVLVGIQGQGLTPNIDVCKNGKPTRIIALPPGPPFTNMV